MIKIPGKISAFRSIWTWHWVFMLGVMLFLSCDETETKQRRRFTEKQLKEPLIETNKKLVKTEEQHILDFIKRYKWPLEETGSGLRYFIYEEGDGKYAKKNDVAYIDYVLLSIAGDTIYSSDENGLLIFRVGKGQVPGGLEEGILLLRKGDNAKFIIPSHLGYGLLGDDNKIPPKATLVYDLKLIDLK